jgi:hypothetical protein
MLIDIFPDVFEIQRYSAGYVSDEDVAGAIKQGMELGEFAVPWH